VNNGDKEESTGTEKNRLRIVGYVVLIENYRKRPANSILPEFSTDGMIVFGWSNAMAPVL
jgi:hypothetical protein